MNATLNALIDDIDESCSLTENYQLFMKYFLDCLSVIQEHFSEPVLADCFFKAKAYWGNELNVTELDKARVRCWTHLHSAERQGPSKVQSVFAMRALICTLYAKPPSDDTHELLYWFLEHVVRVAAVDDDLIAITKRYFPNLVSESS